MAGVCEGEYVGLRAGDEPLILMRFHRCGMPQLYEALEVPSKVAHFRALCVPTPW